MTSASLAVLAANLLIGAYLYQRQPLFRPFVVAALVIHLAAGLAVYKQPQLAASSGALSMPIWQPEFVNRGSFLIGIASLAFLIGAVLATVPSRTAPIDHGSVAKTAKYAALHATGKALPLGYLIVALWLVSRGFSPVFSRTEYGLGSVVPYVGPLLNALFPIAFLIGLFASERQRGAGLLLAFLTTVCIFATGSRQLALLPILVLAAQRVRGRGSIRASIGLVLLSWLGLALALQLREQAEHGLIPYLSALSLPLIRAGVVDSLGNLLFAVPLTGWVSLRGNVSAGDIITSVNPLPGGLTDWAEVSQHLRYHYFIPYNGIGELASYSVALLFGFFVLFGVICLAATRVAARNPGVLGIVLMAAPAFPLALLLQYNLRSGVRMVYLVVGLVCLGLYAARRGVKQDDSHGAHAIQGRR